MQCSHLFVSSPKDAPVAPYPVVHWFCLDVPKDWFKPNLPATSLAQARAITEAEKGESAYKKLKKARTAAHYQGDRIKKAKAAAAKET